MTTSAKEHHAFYSVETPSVFREIELPMHPVARTAKHRADYDELADLAERHGTYVREASYRRG